MSSDWARLPDHLLDSVFERIMSPSDYLRASVVCESWHRGAKHNKKHLDRISDSHRSPPMLLIPTGKNGIWRLYNAMNDKVLDLQIKLRNKRFCGSSKGWLIVVESDFTITLINPFRRIKGRMMENSMVHLPPISIEGGRTPENSSASECEYCVFKATISADPILNPNECTVVVTYEDKCKLAFFRLGKDKTWNYVDQRYTLIDEVAFVEDKNYALDNWSKLLSFDIATPSNVNVVARGMKRPKHMTKRYLVALNEREFVLVIRHIMIGDLNRRTIKIEAFELDFENRKWIEKNTLGDVAFFVGDNSSIFVQASAFSGCEPNCIYYTCDHESVMFGVGTAGPVDCGVYNVKTKRFLKPYGKFAKSLIKKAVQPPIWVLPNLFKL